VAPDFSLEICANWRPHCEDLRNAPRQVIETLPPGEICLQRCTAQGKLSRAKITGIGLQGVGCAAHSGDVSRVSRRNHAVENLGGFFEKTCNQVHKISAIAPDDVEQIPDSVSIKHSHSAPPTLAMFNMKVEAGQAAGEPNP
jgi:hypothetical protein